MRPVQWWVLLCGLFLLSCASQARAQEVPGEGAHELEFWTAGGHGTNGITSQTGVWNAGVRYGWVLTAPHGPGFLRGRFEYSIDVMPLFVVFRPDNTTAYGGALSPVNLKWNFSEHRRVVPCFELSGGGTLTDSTVPQGTSHFNFLTGGALGARFIRDKLNLSAEVRFMHISNSGLAPINPGINTLQLRLGVGFFGGIHHKG